ncbi:MAG: GFA family protein [Acetobacteraceae bacterium]|nr:GFA family protein [Acetobacteraceae bacterium]
MTDRVSGGCRCGAVRFESDAPPFAVRACWCRDCQYFAAGSATVNAIFRRDGLRITGELREYESTADSGTLMHRGFCPACGTPLTSRSASRPEFLIIRVGALDEPARFAPESTIWTASAPPWARFDDTPLNCEGQPPPPVAR